MIVPTLRVGMHPVTLCLTISKQTQSVQGGIPTQSVGTIGYIKIPFKYY
jgi:hypothetical protein